MKVYIVVGNYPYEGDTILKVFLTESNAFNYRETAKEGYQRYDIREYEVEDAL